MSQTSISQRQDQLLNIAGYLTLAAVGLMGLILLYQDGGPWQAAAVLLVAFGIALARTPPIGAPQWHAQLYLGLQSAMVITLLALSPQPTAFPMLFMILSAQVMMLLPQSWGALWIAVFTVVTGLAMIYQYGWPGGLAVVPVYFGGYCFFAILANALVRADEARRDSEKLLAELQDAHQQLSLYAERVEELAVVEERNRLAREMHDTLGHRLTVAAVQLEGAQRLCPRDPARAAGMVGTVRDQVREALRELRDTVARLRQPLEADLQLCSALARLTRHFEEATGLTVHLMLPEELTGLPDAHRLALFRAGQEALTNVQRHAKAQEVWLQLTQRDGMIALLVGDNGQGVRRGASEAGFGLRGLSERAARLGGELHLEPRPGGGAQLTVRLPLPAEIGDE
jgi:signal transduction histidine kinase